jgi:hypothetical protein
MAFTSPEERAQSLLERMRETPMRRGALSKRARQTKLDLTRVITAQGVVCQLSRSASPRSSR